MLLDMRRWILDFVFPGRGRINDNSRPPLAQRSEKAPHPSKKDNNLDEPSVIVLGENSVPKVTFHLNKSHSWDDKILETMVKLVVTKD